jgi:hypothetical protein
MPPHPSFQNGVPCKVCNKLHVTFLDPESVKFWTDLDIPMDDIEQWSVELKALYVPPDKPEPEGRPAALKASTQTLKNREKALRAYYRKKARETGEPIPDWAAERPRGRPPGK